MKNQDKVYIDVPFKEKDKAKELGAWWDPDRKSWFVPKGKEVEPFKRWLPEEAEDTAANNSDS